VKAPTKLESIAGGTNPLPVSSSVNDSDQLELSAKAGRTRSAILVAAESLFARKGYAATRLEDVAEAVGLTTRAALFYYFPDKQALYDAMLENAFGSLAAHLDEALSVPGPIATRIERAVEAWVDAIMARPTIARLILRYVADAEERPAQRIYSSSERLLRTYLALFEEGRASGELEPLDDNPFHAASAVIGTTVFYVSALAALIPFGDFEPLAPRQVTAHKRDVLSTVQRLLGIADRPRKARAAPRRKTASGRRGTPRGAR
jgi:TetR/AcrR family transcriptional regulator